MKTYFRPLYTCGAFNRKVQRAVMYNTAHGTCYTFEGVSALLVSEVLAGNWPPAAEVLEVLGETEHLRWNAFHFVMGYSPMSTEEFDERAETYRKRVEKGLPGIRLSKDAVNRTHACLIPWDELDSLPQRSPGQLKSYDVESVRIALSEPSKI